ncbi:unnamed protein product [Polarella glacialis]|uniref:Uncharacterized protein n=1 Tax=Polarella glacialis TaxID=89957 RepID=A0A813HUJ0_POLGL|nr:unnamed protein product [Polarella glacialis]
MNAHSSWTWNTLPHMAQRQQVLKPSTEMCLLLLLPLVPIPPYSSSSSYSSSHSSHSSLPAPLLFVAIALLHPGQLLCSSSLDGYTSSWTAFDKGCLVSVVQLQFVATGHY